MWICWDIWFTKGTLVILSESHLQMSYSEIFSVMENDTLVYSAGNNLLPKNCVAETAIQS